MNTQLRFQRHELKYYISERLYSRVIGLIEPYMELDPFSQKQETKSYLVRSLYLDTFDRRFYNEKLAGLHTRKKLRIRGYNNDTSDIFLEIKRRYNDIIVKQRAKLEFDELPYILDGYGWYQGNGKKHLEAEIKTINNFTSLKQILGLESMVLIAYEREAYMGVFDSRARLTFDRNLRCLPGKKFPLFYSGTDWLTVENRCILELKFDGKLPFFFSQLIRKLSLRAESISKYCKSIEKCGAVLLR